MPSFLIAIILAAPAQGPVLWRFPDAHAPALLAAVEAARGEQLPEHLVGDAQIDAWLAKVQWPEDLGCLDDSAVCPDLAQGALGVLGLVGRIDATAETGGPVTVTLSLVPAGEGAPQLFKGQGSTLEQATGEAIAALRGHATLRVEVAADVTLYLGDEILGRGPGDYVVPPGTHTLRAEAPGKRDMVAEVQVEAGQVAPMKFELPEAFGRLVLRVQPPEAVATLDGEPIDYSKPRDLRPGAHRLKVTAKGYVPYDYVMEVKTATQLDLDIKLQKAEPEWQKRFRSPHPDTLAKPYYLRAGLRLGGVEGGSVDVSQGRGDTALNVQDQNDRTGIFGFELGVGWRARYLTVEALTLAYEGGGGPVDADLGDSTTGRLDQLSRLTLRAATVGFRWPAWRLDPYISAGPALAFESFEVSSEDGSSTTSLDNRLFLIGVDLGVRYHVDDTWFAGVSGSIDFWPGERTSGAFVLNLGYALDLPEWL